MTGVALGSTVCVHASAREFLQGWLWERVNRLADAALEVASQQHVAVQEMHLTGIQFADDGDRQVTLTVFVEADDDRGYEFWAHLATHAQQVASIPLPQGATIPDVRLEVSVRWDDIPVRP